MSCPDMPALGVYVLGAVDEAEHRRVDAHLGHCAECREELDRLMPLPRHLARLTEDEVVALEHVVQPPAGLLTRLRAAQGAAHRRLVRQRIAVVAALALALVAGAALLAGGDDAPAPAPAPVTRAAATDGRSGVRAAVSVAARAWGTELSIRMRGATPGERCRLVVVGSDGRREVAATWRATYLGTAEVTGAAAIPRADVAAVDVVTRAGHRLVHVPISTPTPQEDAS